jgi:hypothetical protein
MNLKNPAKLGITLDLAEAGAIVCAALEAASNIAANYEALPAPNLPPPVSAPC